MATAVDVGKYILAERGPMSAMKLQKLVYYAQAWHLVFTGDPLYDDPIEAWANGPVVRSLYGQHRGRFELGEVALGVHAPMLTDDEKQTIDAVLDSYGDLDARQLSALTHAEQPWIEARHGVAPGDRSNVMISLATMQEFYEGVLAESSQQ